MKIRPARSRLHSELHPVSHRLTTIVIFAAALASAFQTPASGQVVTISVPGTSNPWLAGMPNGSTDRGGDTAPINSPKQLTSLSLVGGGSLGFTVSGGVNNSPGGSLVGPDGSNQLTTHGSLNGLSDVNAPVNSLVGVFLGPTEPTDSSAPASLDFATDASRDYSAVTPELKQLFFIGDGLASNGHRQQVIVPAGATRLFLGTMDGSQWNNNSGSFDVRVEVLAPKEVSAIIVPGTANPWLAGMPAATRSEGGDIVPNNSPIHVLGLALLPGTMLAFDAKGETSNGPGPLTGPDGEIGNQNQNHNRGAENGISNLIAPIDSLVGVFLGPNQPNFAAPPLTLNFSSPPSRDYLAFAPELQQAFFIGDGVTSGGQRQQIVVPAGATRLFLGTMDGSEWSNNRGSFAVNISEQFPLRVNLLAGLTISGIIGRSYRIDYLNEIRGNLNWLPLTTTPRLTSTPYVWIDTQSPAPKRFYRAVLLP